jgi:hypothetical protein
MEQVQAATKKYVRPESSAMLLVGDRSKVEAPLRELKLGDIVLLDINGRPVTTSTSAAPATPGRPE